MSALTRWSTHGELILLGAIWGASFLFMRIAAGDFGAFALVEVRMVLGAAVLLPFLWGTRFTASQWRWLAGIGAINSAIPFALFAWAAQRAPAGIGAITNAMAVMFTALIAYCLYGERIGRQRAFGLVAGFIGVVVLAGGKIDGASVWPAALAGTLAAALYGTAANLIRQHLADVPAGAAAAATLTCAAVLFAPLAIATWPNTAIPARSWLSGVLLGVLCTGIGYARYYRLIHRIGASRASMVTYLIPLFGVIWAWWVLDEPLTLGMAIAGVLILGGVALGQRRA